MPAIERILCAIDFSDCSRHAIGQAAALARWYGSRLTVLHVYPAVFLPVPGLPPPPERVGADELERARREADAFVRASIPPDDPVDILIESGAPARQILDGATRLRADLIVMGTHGASGFEHFILGSVAEKVLRKASCPVLTVPPRVGETVGGSFRHVLCAVDFSAWSLAALQFAEAVAEQSGGHLTLAHVIEWPWREPPAPHFADLPSEQAAALLTYRRSVEHGATARLIALVPPPLRNRCTTQVVHGASYVELLALAARESVDLIVLGVHGRSAVDVVLFGSTTNQIVRRAACPVLTVRR